MSKEEDLATVLESARAEHSDRWKGTGCAAVPILIFLIMVALQEDSCWSAESWRHIAHLVATGFWFFWVPSGICLAIALVFLVWQIKEPPEKNIVYRILKERPEDVVWVYPASKTTRTTYVNTGETSSETQNSVVIGLIDGSSRGISNPGGPQLIEAMARLAGNVTVGYREEYAEQFNNDPKLLRR